MHDDKAIVGMGRDLVCLAKVRVDRRLSIGLIVIEYVRLCHTGTAELPRVARVVHLEHAPANVIGTRVNKASNVIVIDTFTSLGPLQGAERHRSRQISPPYRIQRTASGLFGFTADGSALLATSFCSRVSSACTASRAGRTAVSISFSISKLTLSRSAASASRRSSTSAKCLSYAC